MIIGEGGFYGGPKTFGSTLTVVGQTLAASGSSAAPGLTFGADPTQGMYRASASNIAFAQGGGKIFEFGASTFQIISTTATIGSNADMSLARTAVGSLNIGDGGTGNGQFLGVKRLSELTTIAAAVTTDTTIQIPANAIVIGVTSRVTVQPPGTATTDVGVAGATTRYATGASTVVGTTTPGTIDGLRYYASAISIRYTPNGSPSDATGRIRTTIFYLDITPATS